MTLLVRYSAGSAGLALLALAACSAASRGAPDGGRPHGTTMPRTGATRAVRPAPAPPASASNAAPTSSGVAPKAPAPEAQLDPDGNDEEPAASFDLPAQGHFVKVGRHWGALQRVCDFAVRGSSLFMAHATRPLGLDGASVTRYEPGAKREFALAFDWNRTGEPSKGGGGGQGFLRLRNIDGRLYVPDADPPYLGLGMAKPIEGYVFVSDASGAFAPARMPGHTPPRAVTADKAGTAVLPGALHGFDIIKYRGKIYASTSAMIPPNGSAPSSPGTLLTPVDASAPWRVAFTYAGAPGEASVRLGYMTRFRDRLFVAVSPIEGIDRHDYVVIAPPRSRNDLEQADATPVKATPTGRAHTLRWYTDRGKLYWLSIDGAGAFLRVSQDGESFSLLELPSDAGLPAAVLRAGEHLLVLAEFGLYELGSTGFVLRARAPSEQDLFAVDDGYCAPPMAVFQGSLYVGDQKKGALWKLEAT